MRPTLYLCMTHRIGSAGSCGGAGNDRLFDALKREIAARGLTWQVAANPCMGHCGRGPNLKAAPAGPFLEQCDPADPAAVIERLLKAGWPP
jgi:hypothetical protein